LLCSLNGANAGPFSKVIFAPESSYWSGSTHVDSVGLHGATDEAIWSYAETHDFTIVTKDDDFCSLALVRGAPPKVIWLQIGNASTAIVAQVLKNNALLAFALQPAESLQSLRR
jgi:predicted nuclease of predicted toxin-antitoxin system